MKNFYKVSIILGLIIFANLLTFIDANSHSKNSTDCISCHDNLTSSISTHFIESNDDCLFCHSLDNQGDNKVKIYSSNNLCIACHVEQEAENKHDQHAYMECVDCHNPHGSNEQFNLSDNLMNLCTNSCHNKDDIGLSHPVGNEIQDMHSGGELTCISSCHSLHQPQEQKLLQTASLDLCNRCHSDKV